MATSTPVAPLAWTGSAKVRSFLADLAPKSVGHRLKELRDARGISQETLAHEIGVRARTISRWETGATSGLYDEDVLEKLAGALKVKPDDIVGPRPTAALKVAEVEELRSRLSDVEAKLDRALTILEKIDPDQIPDLEDPPDDEGS